MICNRKTVGIAICGLLLIAGSILAGKTSRKSESARSTSSNVTSSTTITEQRSTQNSNVMTTSPATGEQINWQVISAGGGIAVSPAYNVNMTIAQPAIGNSLSGNYGLFAGFIGGIGNGTCCANRGNVDDLIGAGGPIDVSDLTYLVAYLFQSGPPPPCEDQGNVDSIVGPGGPIDVSDLTYIVAFLFQGGPMPPAC